MYPQAPRPFQTSKYVTGCTPLATCMSSRCKWQQVVMATQWRLCACVTGTRETLLGCLAGTVNTKSAAVKIQR